MQGILGTGFPKATTRQVRRLSGPPVPPAYLPGLLSFTRTAWGQQNPPLPPPCQTAPPAQTVGPGTETPSSPRLPRDPETHHRELAVSEPHDPAGAFGGATPARHPPRHNAAWPPGEAPQFPPHQLPNAKAPAVLEPQGAQVITLRSRGPAPRAPPRHPQPWASEGQDSQGGSSM